MSPPILAIDCSFGGYSLALFTAADSPPLACHSRSHPTESIIADIDMLLTKAQLRVEELGALACGIGPGLFSGIRASVATATGIAFVHDLPVYCVPTPLAVAHANEATQTFVAHPAHIGYCYLSAYEKNGAWQEKLAPTLYSLDQPLAIEESWPLCLHEKLRNQVDKLKIGNQPHFFDGAKLAANVGELSLAYDEPIVMRRNAMDAKPLYVRNKVALTKQERIDGVRL